MNDRMLEPGRWFGYRIDDRQRAEAHRHQAVELLYVLEGKLELTVDGERFALGEQDVAAINSGAEHEFCSEGPVLYVSFYFDYAELIRLMQAGRILFLCNSAVEGRDKYQALHARLKAVLKMSYEQERPDGIALNTAYYRLIERLVRDYAIVYASDDPSGRTQSRKEEIERYIQANYARNIALKDLADHLYLSPPYASKVFKDEFGATFYKYLNDVRLSRSVAELTDSRASVTAIAMNNGFPNVSSFNKCFRERYGTTPHDYRSRHRVPAPEQAGQEAVDWSESLRQILEPDADSFADQEESSNPVLLETSAAVEEPFFKYWTQVINLSDAASLKNRSDDEQMTMLKENLGFEYARLRNLFSKDMKIVKGTGDGVNFFHLERMLDFMMGQKLKPYLVLNPAEDLPNLGIEAALSPSAKAARFIGIFRALASYAVNRYGLKQVRQWRFEVLFRPEEDEQAEEAFFLIFAKIQEVLGQLAEDFKVGGPGLPVHAGTESLRDFLKRGSARDWKPDFLTLHAASSLDEEQGIRRMTDARYIRNRVLTVRALLKETGYRIEDVQISDWDFDLSQPNLLNDSSYKAAYLVKNIIDCYGLLQALGYGHALDSLSPSADTPTLLYGSPGLLSKQGLKKPSYYAYAFLHIGNGKYFLGKNEYSLMTSDGADNWFIVCHNCGAPNPKYFTGRATAHEFAAYDEIFDAQANKRLRFRIKDARNGFYKIKIRWVNEHFGNVRQEWIGLNGGRDLSHSEIDYLRQISIPQMKIRLIEVKNGILELETELERNEIQSIRIAYQH